MSSELNQLTGEFSEHIKKHYNLNMYGSGGSFPEKILMIDYRFQSKKLLNTEEARQLMVSVAEDMLKQINEKEKLRPFLDHHPFTIKDINISIMFGNISARGPSNVYPATVYLIDGITRFSSENENRSMLVDFHEENFEESKRIVQSQKNPG